jgi:uncharacterized DUF497 family protein
VAGETISVPAVGWRTSAPEPSVVLTNIPQGYKFYTVKFEFDSRKSRSNRTKHGIDFVEAQALWDDPDLMEIPARTTDEPRFVVVGKIGEHHWSGIVTYREGRIRIISVRRSREEEIGLYEG